MLELTFNEIEEFTLPNGKTCQIVGLKLKDIKKAINLLGLQQNLKQLKALENKSEKDLKLISALPNDIFDLMDKIIDLGIIDKETKEPVIFPREYRNPDNDIELISVIMKATGMGGPASDPLPRKGKKVRKKSSKK